MVRKRGKVMFIAKGIKIDRQRLIGRDREQEKERQKERA
jgi:hypothetical protein